MGERDADRAMIATHHIRVNFSRLDRVFELLRNQDVIDPPSDVARARIGERTPPGVVPVTLLKQAQRVDEACIENVLKTLTLLVRKALLAAV